MPHFTRCLRVLPHIISWMNSDTYQGFRSLKCSARSYLRSVCRRPVMRAQHESETKIQTTGLRVTSGGLTFWQNAELQDIIHQGVLVTVYKRTAEAGVHSFMRPSTRSDARVPSPWLRTTNFNEYRILL